MSFDIKLQSSQSEPHKLNKTISDVLTLTGALKDETSLIDPVFLVKAGLDELAGVNYATVPDLNRRYFIRDIVSVTSALTEIHAHIDVLTTYATRIRSHTAIVDRSQSASVYDLTLNDGSLRALQEPVYNIIHFDEGDKKRGSISNLLILTGASDRQNPVT